MPGAKEELTMGGPLRLTIVCASAKGKLAKGLRSISKAASACLRDGRSGMLGISMPVHQKRVSLS